jgi:hypothetical protein
MTSVVGEDGSNKFLQGIDTDVQNYTMLHPRRLIFNNNSHFT